MKRLSKKRAAELKRLTTKLTDAAIAFNAVRGEFEAFREEVCADMQAYYEDRYWHDSDAGQAYEEWICRWETEPADEAEVPFPEYPTEPEKF